MIIAVSRLPPLPQWIGPWMDAKVRRALPRPVAALAAQPESLQEVAEFETLAQNLLSHEEGLGRDPSLAGSFPEVRFWHWLRCKWRPGSTAAGVKLQCPYSRFMLAAL